MGVRKGSIGLLATPRTLSRLVIRKSTSGITGAYKRCQGMSLTTRPTKCGTSGTIGDVTGPAGHGTLLNIVILQYCTCKHAARGWKMGINKVVAVVTKECGLEREEEGKTKEKCVNGATFLTYGNQDNHPSRNPTEKKLVV
jgi:hypothetical protein